MSITIKFDNRQESLARWKTLALCQLLDQMPSIDAALEAAEQREQDLKYYAIHELLTTFYNLSSGGFTHAKLDEAVALIEAERWPGVG